MPAGASAQKPSENSVFCLDFILAKQISWLNNIILKGGKKEKKNK